MSETLGTTRVAVLLHVLASEEELDVSGICASLLGSLLSHRFYPQLPLFNSVGWEMDRITDALALEDQDISVSRGAGRDRRVVRLLSIVEVVLSDVTVVRVFDLGRTSRTSKGREASGPGAKARRPRRHDDGNGSKTDYSENGRVLFTEPEMSALPEVKRVIGEVGGRGGELQLFGGGRDGLADVIL